MYTRSPIGLVMVSVVALTVFLLISLSSPFQLPPGYFKGYPPLKLPEMTHAGGCFLLDAYDIQTVSWSPTHGWMLGGFGALDANALRRMLTEQRQSAVSEGRDLFVRIRIPADASANKLLFIVRMMRELGVERVSMVGVHPRRC